MAQPLMKLGSDKLLYTILIVAGDGSQSPETRRFCVQGMYSMHINSKWRFQFHTMTSKTCTRCPMSQTTQRLIPKLGMFISAVLSYSRVQHVHSCHIQLERNELRNARLRPCVAMQNTRVLLSQSILR